MAENKDKKVLNVPNKRELTPNKFDTIEHKEVRLKRNVPNLRFKEFEGEWKECRLGEIMNFSEKRINASTLTTSNYISTENMLQDFQGVIEAKSVPTNTNVVSFTYGDILISNIRPYLKKVWKASIDGGCSSDVLVMKANDKINNDYLHYVIANNRFINFVMNGAKGVKMPRGDKEQMKTYIISLPPIVKEQNKIATFLSLLDERIATQNKIIEELKQLKNGIIEKQYKNVFNNCRLGDVIKQTSIRNKNKAITNILSVNNKLGFINQREQFEDRIIASDDISNYKIVEKKHFAYNPARINVGSIAQLKTFESGIVSPMYICFKTQNNIDSDYLEYYFSTLLFKKEVQKRLEGSVRLCLSYESLCNIPFFVPNIDEQKRISRELSLLSSKINIEDCYLSILEKQKQYLLRQMFI